MMRMIRKARTATRALAFALVLILSLSCARPSQAFLTELVVGGELAVTAVTLIGQALPQIMLVASNVLALVKTGSEIADTFKRIGKALFGGGKQDAAAAPPVDSQPPSPVTSDVPEIPTLPMDSEAKGSDIATAAVVVTPSELGKAIEEVVETYHRKLDIYNKLSGLAEGSLERNQLAEPYSSLVDSNEQAVAAATTLVMDATRDANSVLVDEFCDSIRALDPASRPALIPVVNRVLEKGKPFAALNGEADGLFTKLEELHAELTN